MRLRIRGNHGHDAEVFIDGIRASDVTHIRLEVDAEGPMLATITRVVESIDVDVEAQDEDQEQDATIAAITRMVRKSLQSTSPISMKDLGL